MNVFTWVNAKKIMFFMDINKRLNNLSVLVFFVCLNWVFQPNFWLICTKIEKKLKKLKQISKKYETSFTSFETVWIDLSSIFHLLKYFFFIQSETFWQLKTKIIFHLRLFLAKLWSLTIASGELRHLGLYTKLNSNKLCQRDKIVFHANYNALYFMERADAKEIRKKNNNRGSWKK